MAILTSQTKPVQTNGDMPAGRAQKSREFRAALKILFLLLFVFFFSAPRQAALRADSAPIEYKLKAVFLFNFAQFAEWPAKAFSGADAPFVIGVLGKDPFGDVLDETVQSEQVRGRKLKVQRFRSVDEIKNCQILFISASENDRLSVVLKKLDDKPILTVGEIDDFTRQGGMVRLLTQGSKIKLRINVDAAAGAGLNLSSKLLRVAEITHKDEVR